MAQDVINGDWVLFSEDPMTGQRVWTCDLGTHIAVKREFLASEALFDRNRELANDSTGKRWGDGQVAASIPLNVYFEHLAEARKNNDSKYIRRWLNDSDHRKFRTFEGKL